jgi:Family of unknown function (DUF6196)
MYISNETSLQTEDRLKKVIRSADFKLFEGNYCFKEIPVGEFQMEKDALAMVRDSQVWSFLIPAAGAKTENFRIFSFHFRDGLDNSGFVGWLASKIKKELGTGVFVICGQNSGNGGIFDYWGVPIEIAEEVINLVVRLTE